MVLITLSGNGFTGSAKACEYCYRSALPSPSTMGLHISLRAFAKTYMDFSIGLAIFIYRIYLILSQLSLSRPHQVPEVSKTIRSETPNTPTPGHRNFVDGCRTNGTPLALIVRLPDCEASLGKNRIIGTECINLEHQSRTLFRKCHQQHRLTASSLCSTYTNIPFHHTHPNPTPAPCISSGINMFIKGFHWQA